MAATVGAVCQTGVIGLTAGALAARETRLVVVGFVAGGGGEEGIKGSGHGLQGLEFMLWQSAESLSLANAGHGRGP